MENKRVLLASRPTGWVSEDNFRIDTVPVPQPRDGEVLVKVLAAGVGPWDVSLRRGGWSGALPYSPGGEHPDEHLAGARLR